ncbi:hypothetical protein [Ferruginibacter albus]|uniref:hypothetical protein n=1 Tax=Ferruginibacter albus TaxID=2875540 RepID=UPI001CC7CA19|nr:hypothetical protein [Ferruginibacter albus]UAY52308.1 hypothetical protein K9M53_01115 [Ferruginibacter albus]
MFPQKINMDLGQLFFLPEWDDKFLRLNNEEGEEWKTNKAIQIAETLYNKWRDVFHLSIAFAESLPEDEEQGFTQKLIIENLMVVAPKIMSAAGDTLYIIKMENAAIIRVNCIQLMEQIGVSVLMGLADEKHEKVIKDEMQNFRLLFKEWVATFEKDDCEDEWGLF